jgi:hypothetical protein
VHGSQFRTQIALGWSSPAYCTDNSSTIIPDTPYPLRNILVSPQDRHLPAGFVFLGCLPWVSELDLA